jgi:hypothetical protein
MGKRKGGTDELRRVVLPSLLFLLVACNRPAQPERQSVADAQPVLPALAAASAAPAPEELQRVASAASFSGDDLVACADLVVVSPALERVLEAKKVDPQTAIDDELDVFLSKGHTLIGRAFNEVLGKGATENLAPPGKPQLIRKPCREQFAGRTIISTCRVRVTVTPDSGEQTRIDLEEMYFRILDSGDRPMRACLAAKGDWWELPKTSSEYIREKHDQLIKRTFKALGE